MDAMASEVSTAGAQQDLHRRVAELERELAEARDHRTATSEILGVLSRSPTHVNAVLDVVAGTAARLCEAEDVSIIRHDGQVLRVAAFRGASWDFEGVPLNRGSVAGRAILDRQLVLHDIAEEIYHKTLVLFAERLGGRP
jgi:hypothetical protein